MIEQALEFLKIGIINNEDVMIVTDAMHTDSIRDKIAKEWIGVKLGNIGFTYMKLKYPIFVSISQ